MADEHDFESRVKFLYPQNFEGTFDADDSPYQGHRRYVVHCTNYFNTSNTSEDTAIKLKRDDLRLPGGQTPAKLIIERIEWDIAGLTARVHYNNMNDEEVAVLYSGQGVKDYTKYGGYCPEEDDLEDEHDYAGDICISTSNETSGDSYDITIFARPHG
jgi:hypothetical protein